MDKATEYASEIRAKKKKEAQERKKREASVAAVPGPLATACGGGPAQHEAVSKSITWAQIFEA